MALYECHLPWTQRRWFMGAVRGSIGVSLGSHLVTLKGQHDLAESIIFEGVTLMRKMKATIYSDIQQIEVQEVDYQKPPPGYILMDTKCTGICGSDLHNYFGNWPPSPDLAAGHETCGLVAEVGEGVTG